MEIKIFDAEYRFMEILWEYGPVNSTELVRLCNEGLGWKKSTTYTTVRRLAGRGILKNEKALVTALVSKDDVQIEESKEHLKKLYDGSMKLFLANFLQKEELSMDEVKELKHLIDEKVKEGE